MRTDRLSAVALLATAFFCPPVAGGTLVPGFVENVGQADERVLFYTTDGDASLFFTRHGVVVDVKQPMESDESGLRRARGHVFEIAFDRASPHAETEARDAIETRLSYFVGNDRSRWRSDVPVYREIIYRDLWPGVDLVFRRDGGRVTVEAFGEGRAVAGLPIPGADGFRIETAVGSYVSPPPAWTGAIALVQRADAADAPEARRLGTDPSRLVASTYLGGSDGDACSAIQQRSDTFYVVAGATSSADFPVTSGAYDDVVDGIDVFVATLHPTLSSVSVCTFLGGSSSEVTVSLALDANEHPVICGSTRSADFPTTPGAVLETFGGGDLDVFVTKLHRDGTQLIWSTYLGGDATEDSFPELVLDDAGHVYVAGSTESLNFPVTSGAHDTTVSDWDAFVCKLSPSGDTLLWGTYLGGSGRDFSCGIALDGADRPIVAGSTTSSDFPLTSGVHDATLDGSRDAFVTTLSPDGSGLLASTYLGGSSADFVTDVAASRTGEPIVFGCTSSTDFPVTPDAYQDFLRGGSDFFVTRLRSDLSSLRWSTLVGGGQGESDGSMIVDDDGRAIVTGATCSIDFPTTPTAVADTLNSCNDACVFVLSPSGRELEWSSYLGGSRSESSNASATTASEGLVAVCGSTESTDCPVSPGAFQSSLGGTRSGFVTLLKVSGPGRGGRYSIPNHGLKVEIPELEFWYPWPDPWIRFTTPEQAGVFDVHLGLDLQAGELLEGVKVCFGVDGFTRITGITITDTDTPSNPVTLWQNEFDDTNLGHTDCGTTSFPAIVSTGALSLGLQLQFDEPGAAIDIGQIELLLADGTSQARGRRAPAFTGSAAETLWVSPLSAVAPQPGTPIAIDTKDPWATFTTDTPGTHDVDLGLRVPGGSTLERVLVCYELDDPASFIGRRQLLAYSAPDLTYVVFDTTLPLDDPGPACNADGGAMGMELGTEDAMTLRMALDFADTFSEIRVGAVGLVLRDGVPPGGTFRRSHAAAANPVLWHSPLRMVGGPNAQVTPIGTAVQITPALDWTQPAVVHLGLQVPSDVTNAAFRGVGTELTLCLSSPSSGVEVDGLSIERFSEPVYQVPCFREPAFAVPVGETCLSFPWPDIDPCNETGVWTLSFHVWFDGPLSSLTVGGIGLELPDAIAVPTPEQSAPVLGGVRLRTLPNPTSGTTSLRFSLPSATPAQVHLYDAAGRLVRALADRELGAGEHRLPWDGRDESGRRMGPGVYFFEVRTALGLPQRSRVVMVR